MNGDQTYHLSNAGLWKIGYGRMGRGKNSQ